MSQRSRTGLVALSLLVLLAAATAEAQIESKRVASGLVRPVFATAPEGDQQRLFIVEKRGIIRILKNGVLLPTPFLDIQSEVQSSSNEQGLLGLAFHPDYATNGYFFVYHIAGSGAGSSVIRRYSVTANPDVADPGSRHLIFDTPQPLGRTNHNGGTICFGPNDAYLYLGLGDGGGANDPDELAQNGLSYMGKMLRFDIDGDDFPADTAKNYALPLDNPFLGNPSFQNEIWSYGWRNPYRFAFDSDTGDLYTADVGQNCWEEIDVQPASSVGGENWGWDIMEGTRCFSDANPFNCNPGGCSTLGLELPIHDYGHNGGKCSVSGGFVYRGADIPPLNGHYFFADYCSRQIWTLRYDVADEMVYDFTQRTAELVPTDGTTINSITGFGQDGRGELYILDEAGQVFQILPDEALDVRPQPARSSYFGMTGGIPNPFSTATHFEVRLERGSELEVSVFDAAGRVVRTLHDRHQSAGMTPIVWDGRDSENRPVPAGVYFVRAKSEDRSVTKRVTFLR